MRSQISDQDTQPVDRRDFEGQVATDDEVVLGQHFNIGGRDVYEDRVKTGHITTQSGHRLAVALVADGVGGQAQGERAAQIAVDSVFWYLRNGEEADVPELLKRALAYANSKVYQAAEESGVKGMSTTASLAVVVNVERLFVANVGDSVVFLYRNGKLNKLTRDHTFANVKVWRGEMSAEQAAQHPKAEVVLRALGLRERVNVDIGFHVGTEEYQEANKRGQNGLPLRSGDSVMVCSDGLVKESPETGTPLVTDQEMIDVLGSAHGDRAAKTLVAFAMGRNPNDNVSAATIHIAPEEAAPATRDPSKSRSRFWPLLTLVLGLVALASVGLLAYQQLAGRRALSALSSRATQAAVVQPTESAQPSATPAATSPPPTISATRVPPNERAVLISEGGSGELVLGEIIQVQGDPALITVHAQAGQQQARGGVIANPVSSLALDGLSLDGFRGSIERGSRVFFYTEAFVRDTVLRVEPTTLEVYGKNACLSVDPFPGSPETVVAVSCYSGDCSYVSRFGEPHSPIGVGESVVLDTSGMVVVERREVSDDVPQAYLGAYSELGVDPVSYASACLRPYVVPTATPTADVTSTPGGEATASPSPTSQGS